MENSIKITLFSALNVKKKRNSFDRKDYKALENKVNHCGRMPEVEKWIDGNVSMTSAICFLCCKFFILFSCCSLVLSASFSALFCHIVLLLLFFSLPWVFHFLFFLTISVCLSLSSPRVAFLCKILFVVCQRSGQDGCELKRLCHNKHHKTGEIDLTFIATVQLLLRKLV